MFIDGIAYYVDPACGSFGSQTFVGGKERIRVPLNTDQLSLVDFKSEIEKFAGLKSEAEKRGLGQSIYLKLCRLDKRNKAEGTKAYAINTQDQWEVERAQFRADSSSVLQGKPHIFHTGYIM